MKTDDSVSRREFFKTAGFAAAAAASGCVSGTRNSSGSGRAPGASSFAYGKNDKLRITLPGLAEDVRVFVIGDSHLNLSDSRDDAYAGFYRRMSSNPCDTQTFENFLATVKKEKPDLLLLAGDIMSFPSLANVEYLKARLDETQTEWFYVSGNHDWHFEGVPGSDMAQREEWIAKRMLPLYQGRDPLMSSRLVKGVRFVAIDNSVYHVTGRQLDFWNAEAAKGDPIVLFMHIPLYVEGWGLFTCGNPQWGAAVDPYWEIERREKWAESLMPSTFAFREAVLSTPNLAAVFSGHIHHTMSAVENGKFMISVQDNRKGMYVDVRFTGAGRKG